MMKTKWLLLVIVGSLAVVVNRVGAEYRTITVDNGGVITGEVRIIGDIPSLPPQPVYKQLETCGPSMADQRLVVGKDGALGNVVVFLKDVKAGKAPPLDQPVILDNVKCAFVPHVSSATVGQTLAIHNTDPFLHDAHAWLGTKTLFNRAIMKEHTINEKLTEPGLVHINCNVRHTWMHAYLFVAEHPYHTVTGSDGRFRIDGVPPGTYTIVAWHELVGDHDQPVTVRAGETADVRVELPVEIK